MNIKIKTLSDHAIKPSYATLGSAGFDLHAVETVVVQPGTTIIVPTDLAFEIPLGYELQVRPRSGVSVKTSLRVILGTVDSDYRGNVGIIVQNTGTLPELICAKDRIAQGIIAPVVQATFEVVEELGETNRGSNGFGSSGK